MATNQSIAVFTRVSTCSMAIGTMLALLLSACGGDSSSSGPSGNGTSDSDIMADTFDDLPVCSDKREGVSAYVKDKKIAYVCENGDWVVDGDETTQKSSSSHHCEDCKDDAISSTSSDSAMDSSDSEGSSSSFVYEQNSSAYERPEVIAIKDKPISGVSQKGPFVTGTIVDLYELDRKIYAQTGKKFTGKISTDDGKFSFSSVTLSNQYALLEANGYFRNERTGNKSNGPITLFALTDLSNRDKVNINLLTHLEYERVLYLVGTGVDFPSAKKQAETEILNAFGIEGEFAYSEDLDIFGMGDGNAALLAFSVLMLRDLNEADLTELLTKFATDIEEDGSWDDETTKAKIADWAAAKDIAGGLASIRGNIEKWNLGTVPEFEKFVRNFWYTNYGLGECGTNNKAEVLAAKNERSITYGTQTRYICKDGAWVEATDTEKDFYESGKSVGEDGELWNGLVTGIKYKYDERIGAWKTASKLDTTLQNACTQKNASSVETDDEFNKFYCNGYDWVSLTSGWRWDVPKEFRLNPEITYGSMTDTRDNKVYKTVTIGSQTWMAENLNYADSTKTPSLLERSWCFDFDIYENSCAVAGRLYTWAAAIDSAKLYKDLSIDCGLGKTCTLPTKVQGICPDGWHLPTLAEWKTLVTEVGGQSTAGKVLKSQTGWYDGGNGTDAFGFSALPVGHRSLDGRFFYDGSEANFWCAFKFGSSYTYFNLDLGESVSQLHYESNFAFSVRCLKD